MSQLAMEQFSSPCREIRNIHPMPRIPRPGGVHADPRHAMTPIERRLMPADRLNLAESRDAEMTPEPAAFEEHRAVDHGPAEMPRVFPRDQTRPEHEYRAESDRPAAN